MPGLGFRPDPAKFDHEPQDWTYRGGSAALPPTATLRHLVPDVLRQGDLNTCVPHACLQALRMSAARAGHDIALGSRLFAYWFARAFTHTTGLDFGTQIRNLFRAVARFGLPDESAWPYDPDKVLTMPSTRAVVEAFAQRRPIFYRRLARDEHAVKVAIASGLPVVFGVDVSEAFLAGDVEPSELLSPPMGAEIAGSHAMLVTGYDERGYEVLNSWGMTFGEYGWCHFSEAYMRRAQDLWVVGYTDPDGTP